MRLQELIEGQVVQFPSGTPLLKPAPEKKHPLDHPPAVGDFNSSEEWETAYNEWKHYRKLLRTKYGNPEFERMVAHYKDWVARGKPSYK